MCVPTWSRHLLPGLFELRCGGRCGVSGAGSASRGRCVRVSGRSDDGRIYPLFSPPRLRNTMASGPAASPTRCANVQRRPVPPRGAAKIFASVTVRTAASPRPCPGPTSRGSSGRVRPRAMLAYDLSGPSRTSDEASGTSSSGSSSIDSASDPTPSSAARMLATESAAARAWSA
eukprot:5570875-Prymnesium_polylepis.1